MGTRGVVVIATETWIVNKVPKYCASACDLQVFFPVGLACRVDGSEGLSAHRIVNMNLISGRVSLARGSNAIRSRALRLAGRAQRECSI